ncbi:MAG: Ig-like domain-containing protein [Planctomycetes bacterium]|nr:Ig-like domain-containing protein [Planctomycetota bacterium]
MPKDRRPLLVATLCALLGASAVASWWLWATGAPGLAAALTPHPATTGRTEGAAAFGDDEAPAGEAPTTAEARIAASPAGSGRPWPTDARWVAVRIVDEAGDPVAGADVGWFDESLETLYEQLHPYEPATAMLWRSPEAQVERIGWRTRSDDQGMARVTWRRWTSVVAADATRFGRLDLPEHAALPADGLVLTLRPEHSLQVRVVDDRGQPAAGVPIGIAVLEGTQVSRFWDWTPVAITGADGEATVRHLQHLAADEGDAAPGAERPWRVQTLLPGFTDDPGVTFTLATLPPSPVELRLPACGQVRARVEVGGRPASGCRGAVLMAQGETEEWQWQQTAQLQQPTEGDGWVRFAWVPIGQRYAITTHDNGLLTTDFQGPASRDEEVTVVLRPSRDSIVLTGRLLAPDGRPLGDRHWWLEARGNDSRYRSGLRTDERGRFAVTLGEPGTEEPLTMVFEHRCHGQRPLRVRVPPRILRPGTEDLGDLVETGGALLATGRFVAEHGPCPRHVFFRVERCLPAVLADQPWRPVHDLLEHQDGTGNFELRGEVQPGRLRLVFGTDDLLPMPAFEFDVGARDLEVPLATGYRLAASAQLAKGLDEDHLFAVLQPMAEGARATEDRQRYQTAPVRDSETRLDLQWPALPAGRYRLALYSWSALAPLLRIDDVAVPAPEGGDPRLVDIDLRGLVRRVDLVVHGPDGTPIEDLSGVAFPLGQEAAAEWRGAALYGATSQLLLPAAGPQELLVAVYGFRPQRVRCDGDRVAIRLDPWPTVEVQFTPPEPLPAGGTMEVSLVPEAGVDTPYRLRFWNGGSIASLLAAPADGADLVAGRALLPIGDGPHHLELTLVAGQARSLVRVAQPTVVLPTSGRLQISVTQAAWAAALARLQPPEPPPNQPK